MRNLHEFRGYRSRTVFNEASGRFVDEREADPQFGELPDVAPASDAKPTAETISNGEAAAEAR